MKNLKTVFGTYHHIYTKTITVHHFAYTGHSIIDSVVEGERIYYSITFYRNENFAKHTKELEKFDDEDIKNKLDYISHMLKNNKKEFLMDYAYNGMNLR